MEKKESSNLKIETKRLLLSAKMKYQEAELPTHQQQSKNGQTYKMTVFKILDIRQVRTAISETAYNFPQFIHWGYFSDVAQDRAGRMLERKRSWESGTLEFSGWNNREDWSVQRQSFEFYGACLSRNKHGSRYVDEKWSEARKDPAGRITGHSALDQTGPGLVTVFTSQIGRTHNWERHWVEYSEVLPQ